MEKKYKKTSENKSPSKKGTIYISGEQYLTLEKKIELIKDLDQLMKKYTEDYYGLHLILSSVK